MRKAFLFFLSHLIVFYAGYETYRYGIENENKIFPISKFIKTNFFSEGSTKASRLQKRLVFSDTSNRFEMPCPKQEQSFVLVGFGQSNSANHAGHRFDTKDNIVNFFNGKCYAAKDPMLGASGTGGSVWLPLAERLDIGDKTIVLATFGIGGTKVSNWLDENYLMPIYQKNVSILKTFYSKPNAVVWIQGESDVSTPRDDFEQDLKEWFGIVRKDFNDAKIYITGTSYCKGAYNNNILQAQEKYASEIGGIFVGSTDVLNNDAFRYDGCHFSREGIIELARLISSRWIK